MRNLVSFSLLLAFLGGCGDDDDSMMGGDSGTDSRNDTGGGKDGPCGTVDENEPNNDRDHAEMIAIGGSPRGCIANEDDQDHFTITVPESDAGGYVVLQLDEVGEDTPRIEVFSVRDNGMIGDSQADTNGADVHAVFAAAGGESYRIAVVDGVIGVPMPYRYTLKTMYTAVVDMNEPNDRREDATEITLGEVVKGTLFAGHTNGDLPEGEDYDDWFTIMLAAGNATVNVHNVATDARIEVSIVNRMGERVVFAGTGDQGADGMVMTTEPLEAGEYYVRITQYGADVPPAFAQEAEPPDHFTREYELTVTQ